MARRYTCPGCGKKVKFGTHFCSGVDEPRLDDPFPEYRSRWWFTLLKRAGVLAVAVYLVLLLTGIRFPLFLYILLVAGLTVVALLVIILTKRQKPGTGGRSPDYNALVRLLHGEKDVAERLISAEMLKYPDFSRQDCVRRVHDRLEYERSRG